MSIKKKNKDAAQILEEMANTFRERNRVYGDNYKNVGEVMVALFPKGVNLNSNDDCNQVVNNQMTPQRKPNLSLVSDIQNLV